MKEKLDAIISFIKGLMQPALTAVMVAVFLILVLSGYNQSDVFKLVVGVIVFWFGYTAFNFKVNGNGSSAGSKVEPPKANGGQSTVATPFFEPLDDMSAVEEPGFDSWDDKPIKPFDADKFMSEVKRDTVGQYGEENPATLFYEALAKTEGVAAPWTFNNLQALRDCREFILGLAEDAFTWKWGVDFATAEAHLNDPRGCTTCGDKTIGCTYPDIDFKARQLGMDYYVALRYYREAKRKVDDLEG